MPFFSRILGLFMLGAGTFISSVATVYGMSPFFANADMSNVLVLSSFLLSGVFGVFVYWKMVIFTLGLTSKIPFIGFIFSSISLSICKSVNSFSPFSFEEAVSLPHFIPCNKVITQTLVMGGEEFLEFSEAVLKPEARKMLEIMPKSQDPIPMGFGEAEKQLSLPSTPQVLENLISNVDFKKISEMMIKNNMYIKFVRTENSKYFLDLNSVPASILAQEMGLSSLLKILFLKSLGLGFNFFYPQSMLDNSLSPVEESLFGSCINNMPSLPAVGPVTDPTTDITQISPPILSITSNSDGSLSWGSTEAFSSLFNLYQNNRQLLDEEGMPLLPLYIQGQDMVSLFF